MIIQTRYLDISLEELRASHPGHAVSFIGRPDIWEELRGSAITITGSPELNDYGCGGPWYPLANGDGVCCPHIAEIGD